MFATWVFPNEIFTVSQNFDFRNLGFFQNFEFGKSMLEVPQGVKIWKKSKGEKCCPGGVSISRFSPFPKIWTFVMQNFSDEFFDFLGHYSRYPKKANWEKNHKTKNVPQVGLS